MIFNKELDESLRLIIESDGKRRNKLVEFLLSIPDELYQQIYFQLERYDKYEKDGVSILDRDDYCLKGECLDVYNRKYSFIIDMFDESLTISRYICSSLSSFLNIEDRYTKTFEIILYAKNRYNNVDVFKEQRLGRVIDKIDNVDVLYNIIKTKLGNMITISDGYLLKKYYKYDINKCLDELKLESLFNKVKNNVKVRKLR